LRVEADVPSHEEYGSRQLRNSEQGAVSCRGALIDGQHGGMKADGMLGWATEVVFLIHSAYPVRGCSISAHAINESHWAMFVLVDWISSEEERSATSPEL